MDDDTRAAAEAIARSVAHHQVTVAESLTAGRVGAALATATKASRWFRGGLVAYQVQLKRRLLGVTAHSVYTEEATAQMAQGAAALMDASVAVATSGIAGDQPMDGAEPGTVFVGTSVDGATRTATYRFAGSSEQVCEAATLAALRQLLAHLVEACPPERPDASPRPPGRVVR